MAPKHQLQQDLQRQQPLSEWPVRPEVHLAENLAEEVERENHDGYAGHQLCRPVVKSLHFIVMDEARSDWDDDVDNHRCHLDYENRRSYPTRGFLLLSYVVNVKLESANVEHHQVLETDGEQACYLRVKKAIFTKNDT